MRFLNRKNLQAVACLGLAAAFSPLSGLAAIATDDPNTAPPATAPAPPPPTVAVDVNQFSPPAREVVKMISAGVPEDVIKSYVENSTSTFNLTTDNVIALHNMGATGGVTAEMLDHDRMYRQNAAAFSAPQTMPGYTYPTAPATAPQPVEQQPPDYYNQLSPYGTWSYQDGYGYGWQPYPGLSYDAYPWGALGVGWWNFCPGAGWCWFPRGGFGFGRFHDFDRFRGFNHFGGGFNHVHNGFGARPFGGTTFIGNHSFGGGFHGFGGTPQFGGHSGGMPGGHFGGISGGHVGGMGGGHSGGMGGGHR